MSAVEGPRIDLVAEDRDTVTRRGSRDSRPVWVRAPRDGRSDADVVARLRYGAATAQWLDVTGVARVLAVEEEDEGPAVVIEDFGGRTLRSVLDEGRLQITEAVRIATQVAKTLGVLHARRVVHKGVDPSSILVNAETGEVKLTGFDAASRLDREEPALGGPGRAAPTPYVAPEQTGRMNRAVDYRADLFALGATLYEMLTGQVPFPEDGSLAIGGPAWSPPRPAALASAPIPPERLRPSVPSALSEVVLKLLSVHAEDRYQSAEGLVSDLNECLGHLVEGATLADFQLGKNDVTTSFRLPQQIYGRTAEREELLAAFGRATRGAAEMFLVSGPSGAGKTALVHELCAPSARDHVYFCAGSGDPVRAVPYGAFRLALEGLCEQILAEGPERAAALGARLVEAVGPAIDLVVEAIPALGRLIPEEAQPPRSPARRRGPTETRDRFDFAFQETMGVLACRQHPLVLFLDDLQWVDPASLRLLQILLRDPGARHLFVVGAVEGSPFPEGVHEAIAAVRAGPTAVNEISLPPLDKTDVDRLVGGALACPDDDPPRALSAFVQRVTAGNPLFVHQLLGWLHAGGILRLDAESGHWQCSLERLRGGTVADDVGTLFDVRMSGLPSTAARALSIAACFGRRFDLATTARAAGETRSSVAADLWAAVESGLIHLLDAAHRSAMADPPGDVAYAFVHSRAHAAALARLSPELRRELRQRAATRLLAEGSPEEIDAALFDLADQLGVPQTPPDAGGPAGIDLAGIALRAGERARRCNAYEAGMRYVGAALAQGGEDAALRFALRSTWAECAYLDGRVTEAEAALDRLRQEAAVTTGSPGGAPNEDDRVAVDLLHQKLAHSRGDFDGALRLGSIALARVGITLPPREDTHAALAAEIEANNRMLSGLGVDALLGAPLTEDAAERRRVEILAHTLLAAYQVDSDLFRLLGAMIVGRSLRHGHAPYSSLGYGAYGVYGVVADARTDLARDTSRLAIALAERIDDLGTQATVRHVAALFTLPLRRPLRESIPEIERTQADLLAAGDLRGGGSAAVQRLLFGLMSGEDLYRLQGLANQYHLLLLRLGRTVSAALTASIRRTLFLLTRGPGTGEAPSAPSASATPSDARASIPGAFATRDDDLVQATFADVRAFASHFVLALQRAYLFGDLDRARSTAAEAEARLQVMSGHPIEAELLTYRALTLAAETPRIAESPLAAIEACRDELAIWAEGSPAGFGHRHLIVAAEAARVADNPAALDLYDRAIESAIEHGHPGGEALAAELASRFHLAAGRRHVARAYLHHARQAYARWGADGKVADLGRRYEDLLPQAAAYAQPKAGAADLAAVICVSQEISGEIVSSDLSKLLLTRVIETACAHRGFLLLRGHDGNGDGEVLFAERGPSGTVTTTPRKGPIDAQEDLARSVVRHVEDKREVVALEHAAADGPFRSDPYVVRAGPRSVICLPISSRNQPLGVLYLENNRVAGAFTPERRAALEILVAQAGIALANARVHGDLLLRSRAQEEDVARARADLTEALARVKDAQKRLLVQEKLATLGGLTAGVAHEIKNPLNFINNFAESSVGIADELSDELRAQRGRLDPSAAQNLEELLGELRGNAGKIHEHGRRAEDIVRSMLEHSRSGSAAPRPVDLNALLKEYVVLAYQGFRSQDPSFNTAIEHSYAQGLAPMSLVPQDIGRVFLNLVNNACYAVHAKKRALGRSFSPVLRVSTRDLGHAVQIRVRDNGTGIPAVARERIFEPFFTTKPTGDGTGLGLSISHDIIQACGGTLEVESEDGEFTEFIITFPRKPAASR